MGIAVEGRGAARGGYGVALEARKREKPQGPSRALSVALSVCTIANVQQS
jgi:hypothetical protein